MKIFSQIHHWFLALAILLVLLSLLHGRSELYETLPEGNSLFNDYTFILRSIALLLLLNWILYSLSSKLLFSRILIKSHVVLATFFTIATFISLLWKMFSLTGKHNASPDEVNLTAIFIVFLLLTQLLYFINLLLGILRRSNE